MSMDNTIMKAVKIKGRACPITARSAQGNRVPGSRAYRAWMIHGFYEGGDVPDWVRVAEQSLRDLFRANGLSAKQFPPVREMTEDEQSVWQFFGRTVEWLWDDDEHLSAHRLLEEAIRRVGDEGWFGDWRGDTRYLRLWASDVMQGSRCLMSAARPSDSPGAPETLPGALETGRNTETGQSEIHG